MMTGKQKIYFLVDAIDDARNIAPSGQPLIIDPMEDLRGNYRKVELLQLFTKLEKDEQILKVLQVPSVGKRVGIVEDLDPYDNVDDGNWHIELLPKFDEYFLKIQQEPEYQEFTGKKPKNEVTDEDKLKSTKYDRKALEKIWNVLQEIEEKRQLGVEGGLLTITMIKSEKNTELYKESYRTKWES